MTRWNGFLSGSFALLCGLVAGCGASPTSPEDALLGDLARQLPPGWRAGRAVEAPAGLSVAPGARDIVVWRAEPAALQPRRGLPDVPAEGILYFKLSTVPYLPPEVRREAWVANERVRRDHAALDRTVANLARDAEGNFLSRGFNEDEAIAAYRTAKARLPEVRTDIPDYHARGLGFHLVDTRSQSVPADRGVQTEMNTAWSAITRILAAYGR